MTRVFSAMGHRFGANLFAEACFGRRRMKHGQGGGVCTLSPAVGRAKLRGAKRARRFSDRGGHALRALPALRRIHLLFSFSQRSAGRFGWGRRMPFVNFRSPKNEG